MTAIAILRSTFWVAQVRALSSTTLFAKSNAPRRNSRNSPRLEAFLARSPGGTDASRRPLNRRRPSLSHRTVVGSLL